MPYIPAKERIKFGPGIDLLVANIHTPGDLNYVITVLAHAIARKNGSNYAAYNEVLGVLDAAKLEFYRRKVAPYEDLKIEQNGDVF